MKYCAFLRGVNVNGTTMKMTDVCRVFSSAGVADPASVLATGNIIFSSDKSVSELSSTLSEALSVAFKYHANLFIKDENEVELIANENPFDDRDGFHTYAFIGVEGIEDFLEEEFEKSKKEEGEVGEISHGTFYWQVPKGKTLDSGFGKILGKKNLQDKFTSRNVSTLDKIVKKLKS